MQVKLFDEEHETDLEQKLNRFLGTLSEDSLIDIKYQVALHVDQEGEQIYCFSAMVVYRA
ncbi:sporulation protein Cse60 [Bacillus songklensis]|uniref:Sporulation protein Cse60 n=1 Tax=Bacillus songklensis TaxID=1069116 RepID=A0ABV8AZ79_9BACI